MGDKTVEMGEYERVIREVYGIGKMIGLTLTLGIMKE